MQAWAANTLVLCICVAALPSVLSWPPSPVLASVLSPASRIGNCFDAMTPKRWQMSTRLETSVQSAPNSQIDRSESVKQAEGQGALGRPFNIRKDRDALGSLCTESWDYLLSTIDEFDRSPEDHPFVLESGREGGVMAFGNLQMMDQHNGWVQAIRSHPDNRGKGYGTQLLTHLEASCLKLEGSRVMSSTHPTNLAMMKVFDKLGWEPVAEYGFFPLAQHRKPLEDKCTTGEEFLRGLGVGSWVDSANTEAFEQCASVDVLASTMAEVASEAVTAWNVARSPALVPSVFRVYNLQQDIITKAVREGRTWVKRCTSGHAVVMRVWSWEHQAWVYSVASSDPASFRAAMAVAARESQGVFIACHSDFGSQWRKQSLGEAESLGVAWPLYAKELGPKNA